MKKVIYLLFFIFGFLYLAVNPKSALATDLQQVVAQSAIGDKVLEVSGDSFYSYTTSLGQTIPEPPAPTNWRGLWFDDSSWAGGLDAYTTNPSVTEGAPHWWCWVDSPINTSGSTLYNSNCNPLGTDHQNWPPPASDPQQITGPSGFQDRETLLIRKTFNLEPPSGYRVSSIQLELWSDNNSWAYIDNGGGAQFITSAGISNVTTGTTTPNQVYILNVSALSMTAASSSGGSVRNTLAIQVSNDEQGNGNPIGVAYRVTATYSPLPPTSTPTSTPTVTPTPTSVVATLPPQCRATCSGSPTSATTGDTITWTTNAFFCTSPTYSWTGSDGLSGTDYQVTKQYTTGGTKKAYITVSSGGVIYPTQTCDNTVTISIPTATPSPTPFYHGCPVSCINSSQIDTACDVLGSRWADSRNTDWNNDCSTRTNGNYPYCGVCRGAACYVSFSIKNSANGFKSNTLDAQVPYYLEVIPVWPRTASDFRFPSISFYDPGGPRHNSSGTFMDFTNLGLYPYFVFSFLSPHRTGTYKLSFATYDYFWPSSNVLSYTSLCSGPSSSRPSYCNHNDGPYICTPEATITVIEGTPQTPNITLPSCIDPSYSGSGINLSWTNPDIPVTWADISTSSNFSSYYHKAISGGFAGSAGSTTAPTGFNDAAGVSGALTLNPGTTYYTRLFNSSGNSPAQSFNIPTCRYALTIRAFLDSNRNGIWDGGEAGWTDNYYPLTVNLKQSGTTLNTGTIGSGSYQTTFNLSNGVYTVEANLPVSIAAGYTIPSNPRSVTISSLAQTIDFAIQPAPPPTATSTPTATPALSPYFQTIGGDVHSNENIQVNH